MTIYRKLILLYVAAAVLITVIVTAQIAQREYHVAIDKLVEASLARELSRPDLQIHIYQENRFKLGELLEDFFAPEEVSLAIVYDIDGRVMATRARTGEVPSLPSLSFIRSDLGIADTGLTAFDITQTKTGTGFWSSLFASYPMIHLTKPILSSVNPATRGLTSVDFVEALFDSSRNDSQVVIGFLHLGIDRSVLLHSLVPELTRVAIYTLFLMLAIGAVAAVITRRVVAPLNRVKSLAHRLVEGKSGEPIPLRKGDEFQDIARVMNRVLADIDAHKEEQGLEYKLLQLRADEHASQLSARDEELTRINEEISAARQQLYQAANYDDLTKLPNRNLFMEQLGLLLKLSARDPKPLAVLCMNIDNFNRVNESLGRSAGDLLLQEVGNRMVSCLRASDMLAVSKSTGQGLNVSRLGGDEFAVVLNGLDKGDSAELVARRIVDCMAEPMTIADHEIVAAPRIGIALAPRDGNEPEELLCNATTALHHAGPDGKDNVRYFKRDMEPSGQEDLRLEAELRRAIEGQQLHLHYQPQVDTTDGSITCTEALLRWTHAELGEISPFRFVPIAEKAGLIGSLGEWVLGEACRQMKVCLDQGIELPRMAINVSPRQLKADFPRRLCDIIQGAGLAPASLELGLSEGVLMETDTETLKVLQELRELGVYLSLENFGTSHATLGYLSRQPLDELKIDRSFVVGCDRRKETARLVNGIIAMARSLELKVVAEGVETEGEYRFLSRAGVRNMRGYLFSRPLPPDQLLEMLRVPWYFMRQIQRMTLAGKTDLDDRLKA